jgi:cobalt-zinc-cadmium efflux system membrane fusion protein
VVAGAHMSGMVSIVSGLNPGETIASTNAFLLKAELTKGAGEDE